MQALPCPRLWPPCAALYNPNEYQCVLCIPKWIARSGPNQGTPPTPSAPYENLEQFLNAYPDMDRQLVGVIRAAVDEFEQVSRNEWAARENSWDQAGRLRAALAFMEYAQIPARYLSLEVSRNVPSEYA